jgi:hypothetical protein
MSGALGTGRSKTTGRGWRPLALAGLTLCAAVITATPAQATPPVGTNDEIAFSREVDTAGFDIFTIDTGVVNFTNSPGVSEFSPDWSANNKHLAAARPDGVDDDIFIWRLPGGVPINLTAGHAGDDYDPAFFPFAILSGPSGLAFVRDTLGPTGHDVFSAPLNEPGLTLGPQTNLTNSPGTDSSPDYAPDGKSIVFQSNRTGNSEVFVMPAAGGTPTNLTNNPAADLGPRWSRDGKSITFASTRAGGVAKIFKMNANGSGAVQLTTGPVTELDFSPTYGGDGKSIIFDRFNVTTGDDELFRIPAGGGAATNLTNNPGSPDITPDAEAVQKCGGKTATLVGDDGPDKITGTKRKDVVDANRGKETVKGKGGNDIICLGPGKGKALGGGGNDRCIGAKGRQTAAGCERTKGIP